MLSVIAFGIYTFGIGFYRINQNTKAYHPQVEYGKLNTFVWHNAEIVYVESTEWTLNMNLDSVGKEAKLRAMSFIEDYKKIK